MGRPTLVRRIPNAKHLRIWSGRRGQRFALDKLSINGLAIDFDYGIRNGEIRQVPAVRTAMLPFVYVVR